MKDAQTRTPRYFIELEWRDGQVLTIRDFRYVPCVAQDGGLELDAMAGASPSSP